MPFFPSRRLNPPDAGAIQAPREQARADRCCAGPMAIDCVETASRAFARSSSHHLRLAMKLASAHQPTGYVGRLEQRALSRKMGGQIPCDGNKDMPALV